MVLAPALGDFVRAALPEGDLRPGLGPEVGLVAEDALDRVEVDGEFGVGDPVGDPSLEGGGDPLLRGHVFSAFFSSRSVVMNFFARRS